MPLHFLQHRLGLLHAMEDEFSLVAGINAGINFDGIAVAELTG